MSQAHRYLVGPGSPGTGAFSRLLRNSTAARNVLLVWGAVATPALLPAPGRAAALPCLLYTSDAADEFR
ncbi:MAG: hypothetical protein QUU85_14230, partial [Candidatus Eisenbacteria bacterium]|nr:hypothetical protein [Candidatus Eisenbacteria bacterium]